MATVIGVRFKKAGKLYYFDPTDVWPKPGDNVIVETMRGLELGEVVTGAREVEDSALVSPLKKVIRLATPNDLAIALKNEQREGEAHRICTEKIAAHKLEMKLVNVEYAFDDSKIIFYFTANGRVDFRELVKDLAGVFHMRIELRQIGVRDEAKMLGGLGACGRSICCGTFLGDFQPVSIKMAKEQNLSLNPTKISGQCGRLMCCLKYEQDYYEETLKKLPRVGKEIVTPDGVGYTTEINVLKEKVRVRVRTGDDTFEVREYGVEEVRKLTPGERVSEAENKYRAPERDKPQDKPKPSEADIEAENDKQKKRYPRPKAVKTLNTDEYMDKYAGDDAREGDNAQFADDSDMLSGIDTDITEPESFGADEYDDENDDAEADGELAGEAAKSVISRASRPPRRDFHRGHPRGGAHSPRR